MFLPKVLLLLFFLSVFSAGNLFSQPFNTDKILDSTALNLLGQYYSDIAVDRDGNIGVTWVDDIPEGKILNFARSTDRGDNFEKTYVNSFTAPFEVYILDPQILYDYNSNIWISYRLSDDQLGADLLYILKSTDGGESFNQTFLGIGSRGFYHNMSSDTLGNIYILWRKAFVPLSCTKIIGGNVTDTITTTVQPNPALIIGSLYFNIAASESGQLVYVVFGGGVDPDSNHYYTFKTYLCKSTDGGLTFSPPARIDTTIDPLVDQNFPDIFLMNNKLYVIMRDNRNGMDCLYYTESADSGSSFNNVERISQIEHGPAHWGGYIAGNSEMIQVIWHSESSTNSDVYYTQKKLESDTFSIPVKVGNPNFLQFQQLAQSIRSDNEGYSYILFDDTRSGKWLIYFSKGKILTGVNENNSSFREFYLFQNYPNPFNSSTIIPFEVQRATRIKIILYDVLGRVQSVLLNDEMFPGYYEINLNTRQYKLSSGVYFYSIQSEYFRAVKKLILLK